MAVLMIAGMSLLFIGNSVNAWGGIYNNRFSPEMIQNMGYGSPHRIYQEVGHSEYQGEFLVQMYLFCEMYIFT